eukprot:TRINITY_DN13542_c0_g1_i1.p1 TRINITY_DN13542_c0_g1~~TRINITY_DN13542_c0_g1_i1.p1  ORF type:complete len:644 (+),score=106.65 TRINITY_DN13542_c0_g1_i1:513-2444(+)
MPVCFDKYHGFVVLIVAVERVAQFGLFDIEGTPTQEKRREKWDCPKLPCPRGAADSIGIVVTVLGVILLDFYFTRGFKEQVLSEKQKLVDGIRLSKQIVSHLLAFNLESAKNLLDNNVENELHDVLSGLVINLNLYRPYLPDTLFEAELHDGDGVVIVDNSNDEKVPDRNPPGLQVTDNNKSSHVAISFTDIVSSTSLWEQYPEGMSRGLTIHNSLVRSLVSKFNGYEVKTIGDSFMVAFDNLADACDFGLDLQYQISEIEWPYLLEEPITLRISAHSGEARAEQNVLTGRCDYFGPTVNKASRMEGAGIAGTVTVVESQIESINTSIPYLRLSLGKISLRGFTDADNLLVIYPSAHSYRKNELLEHIEVKHGHNKSRIDDAKTSRASSSVYSARGNLGVIGVKYAKHCNVAVAKIDSDVSFSNSQQIREAFTKIVSAVDRTGGSVITLCCSWVHVSWNINKKCTAHLETAFECSSLLITKAAMPVTLHIGIATGSVYCGDVGTATQRFISVFGPCMRLCDLLVYSARELGTALLHAACPSHKYSAATDPSLRSLVRPIDNWPVEGSNEKIQILEAKLVLPALEQLIEAEDWGWSESYWEAFENDKWETIHHHITNYDTVGQKIVELATNKASLRNGIVLGDM